MNSSPNEYDLIESLEKAMKIIRDEPPQRGITYAPPFPNNEDLYEWMYHMNQTEQRILVHPKQFDGYIEWCKKTGK